MQVEVFKPNPGWLTEECARTHKHWSQIEAAILGRDFEGEIAALREKLRELREIVQLWRNQLVEQLPEGFEDAPTNPRYVAAKLTLIGRLDNALRS